ncbi:zinc-finger-containing protein [Halomonas cupida]|uniref:zinc-finger-containing protein n=1 Tax=Halomonas cupida TaxID=44933 RepID=UPI003A914D38
MDPRANSEAKIIPPEPLPFVSRRALRRVTDWMAPPEQCPNCGKVVELVSNSEIYGREFGDWPYAYRCIDHRGCDSYVGLHPNTDLPLGKLADSFERQARKDNKRYFMDVLSRQNWSRNQAYAWLAQRMGIPESECHWGLFSVRQAHMAGAICKEALEES